MTLSMAFAKEHLLKYEYHIICPSHILHNKAFYGETMTKKKNEHEFGKSESIYYFDDSETFNSIQELLKSKGLTLTKNKIK